MRRGSIESLLAAYSQYSGKTQDIWNELLKMTGEDDTGVRKNAAELLHYVFPAD